jgi:hypothetical protein
MTPRVRAILESRWENASRPGEGWIWPAPTKSGQVEPSSLKKQHRKALTLAKVRPFVLYSLRHTFLTRWEVKAECEASQSEVSTRTEQLTSGLQQYGFTYRVVLDHELAKQPRPDNAKTLLRYGRRTASDNEREYIRAALKIMGHSAQRGLRTRWDPYMATR